MSISCSTRTKLAIGAAAVMILSLVTTSFALPVFAADDVVADSGRNGTLVAAPPSQPDSGGGDGDDDDDDDDADDADAGAGPCSTAGQSLGWIICPVVQLVSISVSGIYGYIETNFLQMDNDFVSRTSKTYEVWDKIRAFANIAFAIILLIIILSQITGFGVSNYGIKKMLPTLIVMAVLVNLSFFLCEVAVDLSNIVGYGAKEVFDNMITGTGDEYSLSTIANGLAETFLTGGATVAGIALAADSVEFWIMPLVLLLVTALISIVFFFVLLGVRQAGIIILMTLSPLAIVCYALPNTKKIFERWWKIFSALLLVYPICGALMGGGRFATMLLLSTGNSVGASEDLSFVYAFVAVMLQVVPIFFIPSILRSSFTAVGNLGNRLSMLGTHLGRSTTGAIRRSETYKDTQARLAGHNAERAIRHSKSTRGLRGVRNRIGARVRSGNNRVSRALDNSYQRRQARRVNAVAGQHMADQNARFIAANGLSAAERRQNDEMMKNYESNYKSDLAFANSFSQQAAAYDQAISDVDADPTNQDSIARLRALQNILGSTSKGQDQIQRVLNRRLYAAQQAAPPGTTPTLSAGMQKASQTLMNDHGGFKSGNRGMYSMLNDMNDGKVFNNNRGKFAQSGVDNNGNALYNNAYYGAQAANGTAYELANANDDTLDNLLSSVSSMNASQLASVYRNASEAITNDTIQVKPDSEDKLNSIRQAAYAQMQAASASSSDVYDGSGQRYEHASGDNYRYTDASGAVHGYTRNAATGDLEEVTSGGDVVDESDMTQVMNGSQATRDYRDSSGRIFEHAGGDNYTYTDGTGAVHGYTKVGNEFREVASSGNVLASADQVSASDNFTTNYGGSYRDLHASDEFKVSHEPVRRKIEMPPGWMRNSAGTWINSRDGFRNLTPDEVRRAEQYEAHNIQVDIDNDTRR